MSSYVKFFRMLVSTRWPRYLAAGIFLLGAALSTVGAFAERDVKQVVGVVASNTVTNDSQNGAYQYNTVVLAESSQQYQVNVTQFSPALTTATLPQGTAVTLWYSQSPLNDPSVIAVALISTAGVSPTFVTNAYTHPDDQLTSNLIFGAVCVVIAVLAFLAGLFLPASESDAKKREKSKPPISCGEMVIGIRRPVSSAS